MKNALKSGQNKHKWRNREKSTENCVCPDINENAEYTKEVKSIEHVDKSCKILNCDNFYEVEQKIGVNCTRELCIVNEKKGFMKNISDPCSCIHEPGMVYNTKNQQFITDKEKKKPEVKQQRLLLLKKQNKKDPEKELEEDPENKPEESILVDAIPIKKPTYTVCDKPTCKSDEESEESKIYDVCVQTSCYHEEDEPKKKRFNWIKSKPSKVDCPCYSEITSPKSSENTNKEVQTVEIPKDEKTIVAPTDEEPVSSFQICDQTICTKAKLNEDGVREMVERACEDLHCFHFEVAKAENLIDEAHKDVFNKMMISLSTAKKRDKSKSPISKICDMEKCKKEEQLIVPIKEPTYKVCKKKLCNDIEITKKLSENLKLVNEVCIQTGCFQETFEENQEKVKTKKLWAKLKNTSKNKKEDECICKKSVSNIDSKISKEKDSNDDNYPPLTVDNEEEEEEEEEASKKEIPLTVDNKEEEEEEASKKEMPQKEEDVFVSAKPSEETNKATACKQTACDRIKQNNSEIMERTCEELLCCYLEDTNKFKRSLKLSKLKINSKSPKQEMLCHVDKCTASVQKIEDLDTTNMVEEPRPSCGKSCTTIMDEQVLKKACEELQCFFVETRKVSFNEEADKVFGKMMQSLKHHKKKKETIKEERFCDLEKCITDDQVKEEDQHENQNECFEDSIEQQETDFENAIGESISDIKDQEIEDVYDVEQFKDTELNEELINEDIEEPVDSFERYVDDALHVNEEAIDRVNSEVEESEIVLTSIGLKQSYAPLIVVENSIAKPINMPCKDEACNQNEANPQYIPEKQNDGGCKYVVTTECRLRKIVSESNVCRNIHCLDPPSIMDQTEIQDKIVLDHKPSQTIKGSHDVIKKKSKEGQNSHNSFFPVVKKQPHQSKSEGFVEHLKPRNLVSCSSLSTCPGYEIDLNDMSNCKVQNLGNNKEIEVSIKLAQSNQVCKFVLSISENIGFSPQIKLTSNTNSCVNKIEGKVSNSVKRKRTVDNLGKIIDKDENTPEPSKVVKTHKDQNSRNIGNEKGCECDLGKKSDGKKTSHNSVSSNTSRNSKNVKHFVLCKLSKKNQEEISIEPSFENDKENINDQLVKKKTSTIACGPETNIEDENNVCKEKPKLKVLTAQKIEVLEILGTEAVSEPSEACKSRNCNIVKKVSMQCGPDICDFNLMSGCSKRNKENIKNNKKNPKDAEEVIEAEIKVKTVSVQTDSLNFDNTTGTSMQILEKEGKEDFGCSPKSSEKECSDSKKDTSEIGTYTVTGKSSKEVSEKPSEDFKEGHCSCVEPDNNSKDQDENIESEMEILAHHYSSEENKPKEIPKEMVICKTNDINTENKPTRDFADPKENLEKYSKNIPGFTSTAQNTEIEKAPMQLLSDKYKLSLGPKINLLEKYKICPPTTQCQKKYPTITPTREALCPYQRRGIDCTKMGDKIPKVHIKNIKDEDYVLVSSSICIPKELIDMDEIKRDKIRYEEKNRYFLDKENYLITSGYDIEPEEDQNRKYHYLMKDACSSFNEMPEPDARKIKSMMIEPKESNDSSESVSEPFSSDEEIAKEKHEKVEEEPTTEQPKPEDTITEEPKTEEEVKGSLSSFFNGLLSDDNLRASKEEPTIKVDEAPTEPEAKPEPEAIPEPEPEPEPEPIEQQSVSITCCYREKKRKKGEKGERKASTWSTWSNRNSTLSNRNSTKSAK